MSLNNEQIKIERLEDRKDDITKSKKDGSYLALETLTLKTNVLFCGKTFRFNYSPIHLGLMSFSYGWIDGIAFQGKIFFLF